MRVLVTGAAGFIGSHVCEALLARGDEVVGVDAFVPNYPRDRKEANGALARRHARFTFIEADLRVADLRPVVDGIEAVIHEAAMPGLVRSWTELDLYAGCNLVALGRLVDACREAGVNRFIQASTSSVYGDLAVGDESLPTQPTSPYGVTKLAAEHLLAAESHRSGFPAVILRYFSVYGPRQRPDMGVHRFIEAMLDGREILVTGDGTQSRGITHVQDIVSGTLAALDHGRVTETYNLGGGTEITVDELIRVIGRTLGVKPVVRYTLTRAGDQVRTCADTSKAQREIGYLPRVGPDEGLRSQVEWQSSLRPAGMPKRHSRRATRCQAAL